MRTDRQLSLLPEYPDRIVSPLANVASIPQRSPFRHPGGKTWFVPTFRRWMADLKTNPTILVEPFAGGGIISLTALSENMVETVVMVEIDDDVAAVWETIVNGDAEWLATRVLNFRMTREAVEEELQRDHTTIRETAFRTLLKNRVAHGGILADGGGLINRGENGNGIGSRWYPETIARRIMDIGKIAHRIDFRHGDGLDVMKQFSGREDAIFFVDPPYPDRGKRLYRHHQIDHKKLFRICESLSGEFLITYEKSEEIERLAAEHGFQVHQIPMRNRRHAVVHELVIGRNLPELYRVMACGRQ